MKKYLLFLFLLVFMPTFSLVHAQGDVSSMAAYFPANTIFFAATRTDEAFLDWLDKISNVNALTGVPMPSLRDQVDEALRNSAHTDLDSLMAWLGDYAALGVLGSGGASGQEVYAVLQIADRAGAEAFFEANMPSDFTKSSDAEYTIFTSKNGDDSIAVSDTLAVAYSASNGFPLRTREARLDSNATYQKVIGELPGSDYRILVYADPGSTIQAAGVPSGVLPTGAVAAGFSFLDNRTYVVDFAQLAAAGSQSSTVSRIDPDFARFIPRDASMVIHATDFTALYNNLLDFTRNLSAQSPGNTAPDPADQIEQVLASLGIDLQDDVLSWTTGDYALFTRFDVLDVAGGLIANANAMPDLNGRFDFGLVIEATDPAKAETMARKLGLLAKQFGANAQGLTISDDKINGIDVTVLSVAAPMSPTSTFNLDIAIGATDDVLFIATRPAVTSIVTGDGTLATNPAYLDAQAYILPNPTALWFADGEGLVTTFASIGVGTLALMGPSIGNVFDDIVEGLNQDATPAPTPTPLPTPTPTPLESLTPDQIIQVLQSAVDSISSSSISSTITDDGTTLMRLAISTAAQ